MATAGHAQENIALGRPVTFSAQPNYALCTDSGDSRQLTDGKFSVEEGKSIWVQKGTVGWQRVTPLVVTIDLGGVRAISGAALHTAGGTAGVAFPTAVYMAVSDNGKSWHPIGDLVHLSRVNGRPPQQGYAAFGYATRNLQTKGRYVSFAVMATPFVFIDEIEVFEGDPAWLDQAASTGKVITDVSEYAKASVVRSAALRRIHDDVSAIRETIGQSTLGDSQKRALGASLDGPSAKAAQLPQLGRDFKTLLPLNDLHRDILAIHGEFLAAQGTDPLTVWKKHRYFRLPYLAKPDGDGELRMAFQMLRKQFRSDDVLLTNASGETQQGTLQINDAPQNAREGWLQVYAAAWTDTAHGKPVAHALLPAKTEDKGFVVDIPAGLTRRVWFTIDSSKVPAGHYDFSVTIATADRQTTVPITLEVSAIAMGKPSLSLTMWDYTDGEGRYGVTPENRESAIAMMRSHHLDTPWAGSGTLPRPQAAAFDEVGNLTSALDFSEMDAWIARWPGAKRYMVFLNVGRSFAGAKMGTEKFNQRVASWAKALSAHTEQLGLKPEQLGLCLVDEPHSDEQDAIIAAWAKAINTTAAGLTLFNDTAWHRPDQAKIQEAITAMDILCPSLPRYITAGSVVQQYFSDLQSDGRELWFYQASGPSWQMDAQLYYRYQAWHAFAAGATGEGFWSFGDTGGAPTSWNGYSSTGVVYSPVYLGKNTVTDSTLWHAVREGVEDYETLAMLRKAIADSSEPAWKKRAQQTLENAVASVTEIWSAAGYSKGSEDSGLADRQLAKVRALLEEHP